MRPKQLFKKEHIKIFNLSLMLIFILSPITLKAQNTANFSGKWEFDKTKSTPGTTHSTFDGTVIRLITQNTSTFIYSDMYIRKGSEDWKTADELFNIDGKEQIEKDGRGTRKKSIKWSSNKKTLTLTYAETYIEGGVSKDLLREETYEQSDDGKTLTIETYSKNLVTGETRTNSVFNKK